MEFKQIIEEENVIKYLKKRNLLLQYLKSKKYLQEGKIKNIDFKLFKSKVNKIYYFRINRQFRALAKYDNWILFVYKISNHQN